MKEKEDIRENKWDKLLKIHTMGRDDSNADQYHYPYEPTPYSVLERLANTGIIRKNNTLLDYGCGKGRVDFFLSYQTRCTSVGVEYDERIYNKAVENKESAISTGRVSFKAENAEYFAVPKEVDRIYFFNPFSVHIFMKVVENILISFENNPRKIDIILYYPSDDYIYYLENCTPFMQIEEVRLDDLYKRDNQERFLIYELSYY